MRTPLQRSPLSLIQEEIRDAKPDDWEWRILIVSMMLNLTTGKQVRGVMGSFFAKYPTARVARSADLTEMAGLIKPLGLYNRRASAIVKMSQEYDFWAHHERDDIACLFGIGKYALDSWTIFVQGEIVEDVQDHRLSEYVGWAAELDDNGRGATDPENAGVTG